MLYLGCVSSLNQTRAILFLAASALTGGLLSACGDPADSESSADEAAYDSVTGYEIDPATGHLIHPVSGRLVIYDEVANVFTDVATGYFVDVASGLPIDPETGNLIDPVTGEPTIIPGSGGSGSGTGSGGMGNGGPVTPGWPDPANYVSIFRSDRGAQVPFHEYEAEYGETNGELIGPSRVYTEFASEASNRYAVKLNATGDYVSFTAKAPGNSIVVRYSIPDLGEESESWTTLSVYVNDNLAGKLSLTSRYSWTYGAHVPNGINVQANNPSQGSPHHFFDEARLLIDDFPVGAVVTVKKDADDSAGHYVVDLVDLEQVAAPLAQPAGSTSIVTCGATPNNDADNDFAAIENCINQHSHVFIPPGTFRVAADHAFEVPSGKTISGAGMWHSTISGYDAKFWCSAGGCTFKNFSVFGDTVVRDDTVYDYRFSGGALTLDGMWIEHGNAGYWAGPNANGAVVKNSRFRNLTADAVNLWRGSSNAVIENNHARNTGDDAFAIFSATYEAGPATNNVIRNNTVQVPWKANCFGIYGGTGHELDGNVCADTVDYPGILVGHLFGTHDPGNISITDNTLIRAGGDGFNQAQGALKFHAAEGNINGVTVDGLEIVSPTHYGIHFQGSNTTNVTLSNVTVASPGTTGFWMEADAKGTAAVDNVVVSGTAQTFGYNHAGGNFSFVLGDGNSGF